MTPADRQWVKRQLAKLREDIREDTQRTLQDVLTEEARLVMLQSVAPQEKPTS